VLRLDPSDTHLGRMAEADAIAEQVMNGNMNIQDGLAQLNAIDKPASISHRFLQVACFGIASAMVLSLFPRTGWNDFIISASLGMMIGVLVQLGERNRHLRDAVEAVAALLVTLFVYYFASHFAPLSVQSVIISGLIIMMPGLMLTTAINELAHQQLASGSARLAGAVTVLMKLTFGTILAAQMAQFFGWGSLSNSGATVLPQWMPWAMLLPGSFALAVLFKANAKDIPIAMAAVLLGYGVLKICSLFPELSGGDIPTGTFLAALTVTTVSNIYARICKRPGGLIRVPGIILLVPGSLGFQTLNIALAHDGGSRIGMGIPLFAALMALAAGILFGNLLISSRRYL
ncbi:MAG TPA: threonine/serine exporter family protein, partial [Arenimonas sp.]|nr:threonine/serine exporter family protein [Arenimonas sp.]